MAELAKLLEACPDLPTEQVPLRDALGRVLATEVHSLVDVPGFDNSAMDGYAVRAEDLSTSEPVELVVVGEQPAGLSRNLQVSSGQAVRIMTGAPVPKGADTVVQSEVTTEEDDIVTIQPSAKPGGNVRLAGEDTVKGDVILTPGTKLGARQLSAAASGGHEELTVYRSLRVGVVSTGDELAPPGAELRPGQIYESNSVLLAGLAGTLGAEVTTIAAVDDAGAGLVAALDELAGNADVILMSGGVSVGRFDVVRNVLGVRAAARLTRVSIQPGKPQGYALWEGTPILAFPGNPVSVFVSFMVFGAPFLRARAGQEFRAPRTFTATVGDGWKCPEGRRQFIPVRVEPQEGGVPVVYPLLEGGARSHLVTTMASAEALGIVGEEVDRVKPGDQIRLMEIL
mgnify:FL=1